MGRRKKATFLDPFGLILLGLAILLIVQYPRLVFEVVACVVVAYAVALYWTFRQKKARQRRILQSGIREIDVMRGYDFERFLGVVFESMGFKVEFTPESGDFGADLILKGNGRTVAVQAKRYDRTVGVDAIQAVHAARSHYNTAEAWVVTNQSFSRAGQQLAASSSVRLVDRDELIQLILQAQSSLSPGALSSNGHGPSSAKTSSVPQQVEPPPVRPVTEEMGLQLVGIAGPYAGKVFRLPSSGAIGVGRDPDRGIQLSLDVTVSRGHARLVCQGGTLLVHDEGSANGTMVNGVKISSQALALGDAVQFGTSVFKLQR